MLHHTGQSIDAHVHLMITTTQTPLVYPARMYGLDKSHGSSLG